MFRRRRSSDEPDDALDAADLDETDESADDGPDAVPEPPEGPWDSDDTPEDGYERVDLGSLRIAPLEGTELQLQVDEQTGEVQAAMLASADGALELRAFAAPRHGDLWSEVRPQIAADVAQHGGTATELDGRWGVELMCQMQVVAPDGSRVIQPSRIIGVNGARWLLRATFLGVPAVEPENAQAWEDALAAVVVHRGSHAMPAGDALPLTLPQDAQRLT
jgi:Protein of unknown function (DUF3710)